jgi:inner membrane protein
MWGRRSAAHRQRFSLTGVYERMPSLLSHPAVPVAIVSAVGMRRISLRLFLAGAVFSVLPDADVIGFHFGIPYDHLLGHRGFFHSPIFALVAGLIGATFYRPLRSTYWTAFGLLFISILMHGILDAATNGGLGIAFLSPFSNERYFFPWQPIAVSPFGLERFLRNRGLAVLDSRQGGYGYHFFLLALSVRHCGTQQCPTIH